MLQEDELWKTGMEVARQQQMSVQMRELFLTLMVFSNVSDPAALFEAFSESMSEDYEYVISTIADQNHEIQKWMLLIDIQERLQSSDNGKMFLRVGNVTEEMQQAVSHAWQQYVLYGECREMREELEYERQKMDHDLKMVLYGDGPGGKGKFTASHKRAIFAMQEAVSGRSAQDNIYVNA